MASFYFGLRENLFGVEIDYLPSFIGLCVSLFFIGILSEFISYFHLYLSKIDNKKHSSLWLSLQSSKSSIFYKNLQSSPSTPSTPSSRSGSVSPVPVENAKSKLPVVGEKSYNSFELMDTTLTSGNSSRSMSTTSLDKLNTGGDRTPTKKSRPSSSSHHASQTNSPQLISKIETHFDLVKYHPSNIAPQIKDDADNNYKSFDESKLYSLDRLDFIVQNVLKLVEILIGYWLMLIIMTFNFWFLLSLILGYTVGYFFIYCDNDFSIKVFKQIVFIYERIKFYFIS